MKSSHDMILAAWPLLVHLPPSELRSRGPADLMLSGILPTHALLPPVR